MHDFWMPLSTGMRANNEIKTSTRHSRLQVHTRTTAPPGHAADLR